MTSAVPGEHRELAERTLEKIGRDRRVLRPRQYWYQQYRAGRLSLDGLRSVAPLVAAAEEKRLASQPPEATGSA